MSVDLKLFVEAPRLRGLKSIKRLPKSQTTSSQVTEGALPWHERFLSPASHPVCFLSPVVSQPHSPQGPQDARISFLETPGLTWRWSHPEHKTRWGASCLDHTINSIYWMDTNHWHSERVMITLRCITSFRHNDKRHLANMSLQRRRGLQKSLMFSGSETDLFDALYQKSHFVYI